MGKWFVTYDEGPPGWPIKHREIEAENRGEALTKGKGALAGGENFRNVYSYDLGRKSYERLKDGLGTDSCLRRKETDRNQQTPEDHRRIPDPDRPLGQGLRGQHGNGKGWSLDRRRQRLSPRQKRIHRV